MKTLRHLAAVAVLPLLVATGCGGGGDGVTDVSTGAPPPATGAPEPTPTTTYGSSNLPGRFLIPASSGPAALYDLRTGLPVTMGTPNPTLGNAWSGATDNSVVVRMTSAPGSALSLQRVRTSDWTSVGAPITVAGDFAWPKVSPDGRYIATYWRPAGELSNKIFTIFSTATGQVVKRGARTDGQYTMMSPMTWLPDGRYMYLGGHLLYVSSPGATSDTLVAALPLPDNSVFQDGDTTSMVVQMTASPDGTRIAFSWGTRRNVSTQDEQLWVVNTDGTGLRQLTAAPEEGSALQYGFGNPMWSPDSQWVGGVLYMDSVSTAPIFPPDQSFPGIPGGVIGTTGCGRNSAFVLPATAHKVPISWPAFDAKYGIKVRNASGVGGNWVTTCTSIVWVP